MRIEWWWARSWEAGPQAAGSSGVDTDAPYFTTEYGRGMVGVPATRGEVRGRDAVPLRTGYVGLVLAFTGFAFAVPVVGAVGLVVLVVTAGLFVRAYTLSRDEPSFWVDAHGVTSDGLTVPWTSIRRVDRTRISGPLRVATQSRRRVPETWNLLTLEVVEFDGVRGLRPVVIGLANLQRRRRVMLAAATELYDPEAAAAALDILVDHPEQRAVMETGKAEELFLNGFPDLGNYQAL